MSLGHHNRPASAVLTRRERAPDPNPRPTDADCARAFARVRRLAACLPGEDNPAAVALHMVVDGHRDSGSWWDYLEALHRAHGRGLAGDAAKLEAFAEVYRGAWDAACGPDSHRSGELPPAHSDDDLRAAGVDPGRYRADLADLAVGRAPGPTTTRTR